MDFSLTEEQQIAVDSFRRFVETEIRPAMESYEDQFVPREEMRALIRQLQPFGVINGPVVEEYGGFGLDLLTYGLLFEELARVSADLAVVALLQMESSKLLASVPGELTAPYLHAIAECDKFGSIGISEPDVGSNIAEIRTRAKRDGDHFVINGEKQWISNGHYSDFNICVAQVEDEATGNGLALLLVDREHGYESRNIPKLVLNSQSTAQLFFNDVRVPAANMLTPPGKGLGKMLGLLEAGRPLVGLMAVAVAQAALDDSIAYAGDRKQHGKPIAGHQLVQAMIAEMATEIDAARLLCFRALDQIQKGIRSDIESSKAKLFATDMALRAVNKAMEIHGGNGLTTEFRVEKLYRLARIFPITEGTTEMQKLIIGRGLLGVPAF